MSWGDLAGAAGYLLKDLPATELADAVRLTRSGIAPFGSMVAGHLALALAGTRPHVLPLWAAPLPDLRI